MKYRKGKYAATIPESPEDVETLIDTLRSFSYNQARFNSDYMEASNGLAILEKRLKKLPENILKTIF